MKTPEDITGKALTSAEKFELYYQMIEECQAIENAYYATGDRNLLAAFYKEGDQKGVSW